MYVGAMLVCPLGRRDRASADDRHKMGLLLPSILANAQRPHSNYVLVQSSIAQTCLPVLRRLVNHQPGSKRARTILICFLYPPSSLCEGTGDAIDILDYTGNVPGYAGTFNDPRDAILEVAKAGDSLRTCVFSRQS